ncbi:filamin-A [Folsomia candida]|nr:filamin-A [Folsomia candida]
MASANYVQAWGDGLNVAQAGLPATFHINPNGQDMSGITFGVEGPSRPDFQFQHLQGGVVAATYTPIFPGPYRIHIKFFGRDIPGSPFALNVVGDTSQHAEHASAVFTGVKVSGPAITSGKSFITNQFLMDTRGSGVTGGLNAYMEGPGRADVGFKENLDGTIHVQYKPQKSGAYRLHIKFGDTHIQGSPFLINVQ